MSTLSSLLPPIAQPRLEIGDPMPELDWINQRNEPVSLYTDTTCGRATVMLSCRSPISIAGQIAELRDSLEVQAVRRPGFRGLNRYAGDQPGGGPGNGTAV